MQRIFLLCWLKLDFISHNFEFITCNFHRFPSQNCEIQYKIVTVRYKSQLPVITVSPWLKQAIIDKSSQPYPYMDNHPPYWKGQTGLCPLESDLNVHLQKLSTYQQKKKKSWMLLFCIWIMSYTLKGYSTLFLEVGSFYNSPRVKQLSFTIV